MCEIRFVVGLFNNLEGAFGIQTLPNVSEVTYNLNSNADLTNRCIFITSLTHVSLHIYIVPTP